MLLIVEAAASNYSRLKTYIAFLKRLTLQVQSEWGIEVHSLLLNSWAKFKVRRKLLSVRIFLMYLSRHVHVPHARRVRGKGP